MYWCPSVEEVDNAGYSRGGGAAVEAAAGGVKGDSIVAANADCGGGALDSSNI